MAQSISYPNVVTKIFRSIESSEQREKILEAASRDFRKTAVLALLGRDVDTANSYDDVYGTNPPVAAARMLGEEVEELAPGVYQGKSSGTVVVYNRSTSAAVNVLATLVLNLTPPEKRREVASLVSELLNLYCADDDDP